MPDSGRVDWQHSPDGAITIMASRSTSLLPLPSLRPRLDGLPSPWAYGGEDAFVLQTRYTLMLETFFPSTKPHEKATH